MTDLKADDGFVESPKTPFEFLKTVSSEVRAAIGKVMHITVENARRKHRGSLPTTYLKDRASASILNVRPDEKRSRRKRRPSGHRLILNNVLTALHKEGTDLKQVIHARDEKLQNEERIFESNHSLTGRSSRRKSRTKRNSDLVFKPIATPAFVKKLVMRYRTEHDYDEHIEESPEPKRGLSIVSTMDKKLAKDSLLLSRNPHIIDSSKSLAEIRNILRHQWKRKRMTLPAVEENAATTEKVKWGDKTLHVPVLSFQQRAASQRFKAAHNNPEYLSGVEARCEILVG